MSWHAFVKDHEYPLSEIIRILKHGVDSGRVTNVREKSGLIELFEESCEKWAVFCPFGSGWGASPYNPKVWRTKEGNHLISGYRVRRSRKNFSLAVKKAVYDKTNGHCYSCGKKFTSLSEIWIEHIIPFSRGGSDELNNLLPGCKICNYTRQNFRPHKIQRILSIGSVMVRQMDLETEIGNDISDFLQKEEERRSAKRKHKDQSFLIYEPEEECK